MSAEHKTWEAVGKGIEWVGSREVPPRVWQTFMATTLAVTTIYWGNELLQAADILNRTMNAQTIGPMLAQAGQHLNWSIGAFSVLAGEVTALAAGIWNHGGIKELEESPLKFSTTIEETGKVIQLSAQTPYNLPKA